MSPFTIQVVESHEWSKRHAGRKKEPIDPELLAVVRQSLQDQKVRAVVVPNEEVNNLVYKLRNAGHEVDSTVTVQKKENGPGYTKVLFKAGKRVYRTRKES